MNTNAPTVRKPLRLWPGIAGAVLLVIVGYVVPIVVPAYAGLGMIWAALALPTHTGFTEHRCRYRI